MHGRIARRCIEPSIKSRFCHVHVICPDYGESQQQPLLTAPMPNVVRKAFSHPLLALGSTLLWGIVEFGALCRSRWARNHGHRA